MDYSTLAQKYGGTAAPAPGGGNLASLAAKYGGKATSAPPQTGFVQSLVQGVTQPFARLGTNLEGAALGVKSLGQLNNQPAFDQTQQQIKDLSQKGNTLPYIGNVKPVGQTPDFGQNVKDALGTGLQVESVLAPYGTLGKLGTKAAATVLPRVPSLLAGTALAGGAGGYAADVGTNLTENKPTGEALKPGLGTALGVALPVGVEGAIQAGSAARTGLANSAPRVINSLIKPLLKDFSYGKNPGRTVAKLGITGNSLDQLGENIATRRQAIGQQAAEESRKIPQAVIYLGKSLNPLDEAITKAAANNNPTVVQRLKDVKDAITKNLVLDKEGNITSAGSKPWYRRGNASYLEGLEAKQKVGELTKFTGNPSDDKDVNMALKKVYGSIKEALDKGATKADPEVAANLRNFNEQYADLKSAEIATKYRDKIQSRQNLIGFTPTVAGIGTAIGTLLATGGAALPAVLAGISGAAIDKALSSTTFKTRLAAWLAKLAPAERSLVLDKFPQLSKLPFPGDNLDKPLPLAQDYLAKNPPSIGLAMKDVNKMGPEELGNLPKAVGESVKNALPAKPEAFGGFEDVTTNLLDDLKGRSTVSKQYILDALNRSNIKQAEKDIIKPLLDQEGPTIAVKDFANKVKGELLPLERTNFAVSLDGSTRYEGVALPDDLRGPVANYSEHVYNSPIKTSAGDVHFNNGISNTEGYFAHTRTEDIPQREVPYQEHARMSEAQRKTAGITFKGTTANQGGDTRRVIEVQSDLFQKGRLESEAGGFHNVQDNLTPEKMNEIHNLEAKITRLNDAQGGGYGGENQAEIDQLMQKREALYHEAEANKVKNKASRVAELSKLKPYENTWQDRIVREEVKQAAIDGKTKLQFPTGETAMKIEGLGGAEGHVPQNVGVGDTFEYGGEDYRVIAEHGNNEVSVIPDSAVEREFHWEEARDEEIENLVSDFQYEAEKGDFSRLEGYLPKDFKEKVAKMEKLPNEEQNWSQLLEDNADEINEAAAKDIKERYNSAEQMAEYFNDNFGNGYFAQGDQILYTGENGISEETMMRGSGEADIDKDHPIYKYYEDELGKFLKKKYNAERITDAQGQTWNEVNVPEAAAKEPVKAFGKAKIGALGAGAAAATAGALSAQPSPLPH